MQSLMKLSSNCGLSRATGVQHAAVPNLAAATFTPPPINRTAPCGPPRYDENRPCPITSFSMRKVIPTGPTTLTSGIGVTTSVRCLHNDMQVPDFTYYRKESTKDPTSDPKESYESRNAFTYVLTGSLGVMSVYGGKNIVTKLLDSMNPAANVLAFAQVKVDLNKIPLGKNMGYKWRGKPIFIRHRTPEEIATEKAVSLSELRDPQSDSDRVKQDRWLVVIGVCTHLGCVPISHSGIYGGYFCPCHGSHYDSSGRIRKGPAPSNLEIPPYEFMEGGIMILG